MNLVKIDENSCTLCGGCVDECPAKIITFENSGSIPVTVEAFEPKCINCWHCVTVCPSDALEHRDMTPGDCPPIHSDHRISGIQAEQFLRSRRSIRKYRDKSVEKDELINLIKTARYAPSGHNSQGVKWLVINEKEKITRLEDMVIDWMRYMLKEMPDIANGWSMDLIIDRHEKGIRTICRNAPHLIVAYGNKAESSAQTNSVIAMSYLELAAVSRGLGTCWAGFFNAAAQFWPPMQEALGLPENHAVNASMMVGYPAHSYGRLAPRNEPDIKIF